MLFAIFLGTPFAGSENASPTQAATGQPAKIKTIEFFMTGWCPYCRKMEAYLVANKIPFTKRDIESDQTVLERYQDFGGDGGVPLLVVGDEVIMGYDPQGVSDAWKKWNEG